MVNFGPLAAEIVSLVWGTPANFNGFRFLTALLQGTPALGISQTAALNRGHHLYSAGRPSHCTSTHISSCVYFVLYISFDWLMHDLFYVELDVNQLIFESGSKALPYLTFRVSSLLNRPLSAEAVWQQGL